jgi:AcrR family transcriptional regulator
MAKHQPSDVRRAQLFQAALEVCAEKGYHSTRVDDIVKRAGLSKGALYHHFRSKQDLFLALFESMIREFSELMQQTRQQSSSAIEALRSSMRLFGQWIEANPDLIRGMMDFYILGAREPRFRQAFIGYYEELVQVVVDIVRDGMQNGELDAKLDAERVAWVFITAGDGLFFVHQVLEQSRLGVQRMMELLELTLLALGVKDVEHTNAPELSKEIP